MHSMHVWDLSRYDLCMKMAPKRRTTGYSRTIQEEESSTPNHCATQHSTPEVNRDYTPELGMAPEGSIEVIVG
jgi:hypothetical protein